MMMKKKNIFRFLKIAVTLGILSYILRNTDLSSIFLIVRDSHVLLILLALLTFTIYQFTYAYNWERVLATLKGNVAYADLFRYHMIGLFYNLFLPTTMGGDVAKTYYLAKKMDNTMIPIKSIALLRGIGLSTIIIILFIALFFNRDVLDDITLDRRFIYGMYAAIGLIVLLSLVSVTTLSGDPRFGRTVRCKASDVLHCAHISDESIHHSPRKLSDIEIDRHIDRFYERDVYYPAHISRYSSADYHRRYRNKRRCLYLFPYQARIFLRKSNCFFPDRVFPDSHDGRHRWSREHVDIRKSETVNAVPTGWDGKRGIFIDTVTDCEIYGYTLSKKKRGRNEEWTIRSRILGEH